MSSEASPKTLGVDTSTNQPPPTIIATGSSPPAPSVSGASTVSFVPTPPSEMMSAVLQFCVASVSMMLGNKLAVTALPAPCALVIIQAIGTLVLLGLYRQQLSRPSREVAHAWAPIASLFTMMLFTSLKSFEYANVSAVLIFRNVGAIFTTLVEYMVRGTTVNTSIVLSELLIVVGAVLYGWGSATFSWLGLFWILLNVGAQVAYGVLVKRQMDGHPLLKDLNKYTMSMYNNTLALPLIFVVLVLNGEHSKLGGLLATVQMDGWFAVLLTCFFGFLISTSGFGLQRLVSATTFLVINNLTKFLNILLGMMFLSDKLVGFADASGCIIALFAGFWYSYESMKLNDRSKKSVAH